MELKVARFNPKNGVEFQKKLKQRVDEYFSSKNISKTGNTAMVIKTIFMLSLYFVPYITLLVADLSGWMFFLMWFVMGVGVAGVGLSVMHDANHGSYSKNNKINNIIGNVIALIGGHSTNWKIQHNVLHHTYTNIDGLDEDLEPGSMLRFSPHRPLKKYHKYQYLYAWFFYGMMTLAWSITKDFQQLSRYDKKGLIKAQRTTYATELRKIILAKIVYFGFILVLPMVLLSVPWWMVILGFLVKHYTAGLILSAIFQSAHVMENMEFPEPDDNGGMLEHNWAVHQLYNTTNFAVNKKAFSWFVGGLNFQIEHHLFPNICHIHYSGLSKIVKKTAQEFDLPYFEEPTFRSALATHVRMLKQLGRA